MNLSLKPSELTPELFNKLKKLSDDATISIVVNDADDDRNDTEYLMSHPATRDKLLKSIHSSERVFVDIETMKKDANII